MSIHIHDLTCRYCGRPVEWCTSKAGNRYLAEAAAIYNEDGRHIKTIYPAHQCQATPEERAAVDQAQQAATAEALAKGEIIVGQQVVVAKGRKVPVGTTGTVVWVARFEDGYGVIKAKVEQADGTVFSTNIKNLAAQHLASK